MWLASSAVCRNARSHQWGEHGANGVTGLGGSDWDSPGKSEDAFLSGLGVEQHLVFHGQWVGQPLQRQPEQRQRQLEQRHER